MNNLLSLGKNVVDCLLSYLQTLPGHSSFGDISIIDDLPVNTPEKISRLIYTHRVAFGECPLEVYKMDISWPAPLFSFVYDFHTGKNVMFNKKHDK